jgi:glutamine amidotransferase
MRERRAARVAIVDYGVGNLFSVRSACHAVGLDAEITPDRTVVLSADAVIVPGVGAFGDAMATLHQLDLVEPLRDVAASGKPLIGICLGMQLFMAESEEFGRHRGLSFFAGPVRRLAAGGAAAAPAIKVPQVGWNRIAPPPAGAHAPDRAGAAWTAWPLHGIVAGEYMYFVHSYYASPEDPDVVLTRTRYGDTEFCSGLLRANIFACQFHPERSGARGLDIYRNIARRLASDAGAGNMPRA